MLGRFIMVINCIKGTIIFGFKDGDARRNVLPPKLSIDGIGRNGSLVGASVELPICLIILNIDLGQMRDWNGKVIPLHLQEKALTEVIGLQ